jgi:hypothetical protein
MPQIPSRHHPGRHCASTGLCNLANHHGLNWSEAMCFGLGAGLGIWYLHLPNLSPRRMIHVRSLDLENQFFQSIGHPFKWEQYDDPLESERALIAVLDRGTPAILQTDIYDLPYYESKTHFPGHVITVWGYDNTERIFLISDTERENLLAVPFENMRRARFGGDHLLKIQGNLFSPRQLKTPDHLSETIRKAIAFNSDRILNGSPDLMGVEGLHEGINALTRWKEELATWPQLEDWKWSCRFTYQVIEKRGSGGGGFRVMYTDFLKEAAGIVPDIQRRGLPEMMAEISLAWRGLAERLKAVSELDRPDFHAVTHQLQNLERLEADYHLEAKNL